MIVPVCYVIQQGKLLITCSLDVMWLKQSGLSIYRSWGYSTEEGGFAADLQSAAAKFRSNSNKAKLYEMMFAANIYQI